MAGAFYGRYLTLLDEIERRFPVSAWKCGDLDLWPLARMDLYLDMYWAAAGSAAPAQRPMPMRVAGHIAMPIRNLWKSRGDFSNHVTRPTPAHAIFLGDGLSLDRAEDGWRDRFGEPLIDAFERRGLNTFLMQSGYLSRLPWHRPTFAANIVESRGFLRALITRRPVELPAHSELLEFLSRSAVNAPSLDRTRLERRANLVIATAAGFERVLSMVRPTLAFVVGYYAGSGPAFLLACRRRGILSVDLQRAPYGGLLHAYRWRAVPPHGYATLPAVFWSWTEDDATHIDDWAASLAVPRHGAIHGGHTQMAAYLDDDHPATRQGDASFVALGARATFEREILVALQPIHGHRAVWDALCTQIEASPASWRWWIRRHPTSRPDQDVEFGRLLALRLPNVLIAEASALPLPALLRHVSAMVSLASGAVVEASMLGVPAFFLIDAARYSFADVIARGAAAIIDVASISEVIAKGDARPVRRTRIRQPDLELTLIQLEDRARIHRRGFSAA